MAVKNLDELKEALYEDFNTARKYVSSAVEYYGARSEQAALHFQAVAQLAGKIIDLEREQRKAKEYYPKLDK